VTGNSVSPPPWSRVKGRCTCRQKSVNPNERQFLSRAPRLIGELEVGHEDVVLAELVTKPFHASRSGSGSIVKVGASGISRTT